jgi:hypothetical protein
MTATIAFHVTERELDALARSTGLGHDGPRKSIALQAAELKLYGAIGAAMAARQEEDDQ